MLNLKDINWKKPGLFALNTAAVQLVYNFFASSLVRILCYEDCNKRSGECRRYLS